VFISFSTKVQLVHTSCQSLLIKLLDSYRVNQQLSLHTGWWFDCIQMCTCLIGSHMDTFTVHYCRRTMFAEDDN